MYDKIRQLATHTAAVNGAKQSVLESFLVKPAIVTRKTEGILKVSRTFHVVIDNRKIARVIKMQSFAMFSILIRKYTRL